MALLQLVTLSSSTGLEPPPVGDCSGPARRSAVPTVVGPTPPDQPAHDDDQTRAGQPGDHIGMRGGIHYIHQLRLQEYQERLERSSRCLELVRERRMALHPLLLQR